jgi:hypothetical protein
MLFGAAAAVVAAVGVVAAGSRAGLLLLGPAAVAGFLIATRTHKFEWKWTAIAAAVLVAVVAVAVFVDPGGSLGKLRQPLSQEVRLQVAPDIARAALIYGPVGTGLGSFDPVYRTVEPESAASTTFLNHAHDDYLELWLETGLVGVALLIAFFYWYGRASWRAWVSERRLVGASLGRAGSTVAALLLAHSIVDYPLRTTALAVVFAFACGVLNPPRADRDAANAAPRSRRIPHEPLARPPHGLVGRRGREAPVRRRQAHRTGARARRNRGLRRRRRARPRRPARPDHRRDPQRFDRDVRSRHRGLPRRLRRSRAGFAHSDRPADRGFRR